MRIFMLTLIVSAFIVPVWAQQSTIDLTVYKNSKSYSYIEKPYTIGKHTYNIVNIKPVTAQDTTCISAIVFDKRKLMFCDLGAEGKPVGLVVPKVQPISGGLVVIKASPIEGKTFIIMPSGKLVTLPGDMAIIDTTGTTVLCVWANDGQYRLTVLDYGAMRILIPTAIIAKPDKWFSNDVQYSFTVAGEKTIYTVDAFSKSINKASVVEAGAKPVSYVLDPATLDSKKCCGTPEN